MDLKASARRTILLVALSSACVFAQNAKTTGIVAPNLAEFRIPLEQPASATWNWNRAETPDNECEYMWQIAVPNGGGRYAFGFYLYKFPGSKPVHGDFEALLRAGQASVFKEDAEGRGNILQNAKVQISEENGTIVLRIVDAELIRAIFGDRPDTVTMNARAIGSDFEVVKVAYRDQGTKTPGEVDYSGSRVAIRGTMTAEWHSPQENATFHRSQKGALTP